MTFALCPRHKNRRLDVAVRGVQYAGTCVRRRVLGDQVEFKKVLVHKLELLGCGSYANHYTGNPQEAPTRQKLVRGGYGRDTANERGFLDAYRMSVDNLHFCPKHSPKTGDYPLSFCGHSFKYVPDEWSYLPATQRRYFGNVSERVAFETR